MSLLARILTLPIRLYRAIISPLLPSACRFYPSCSAYAMQALEQRGAMRGTYLIFRRLLRCHSLNPGGVDPVPPA